MSEGINDFEVEARWAYLSYELSDQHTLIAGKLVNPLFYQSEYEKVGYVHNFARLPKSVYFGFDFATIEGAAINSNFQLGEIDLATKVLYGSWRGEIFQAAVNDYFEFGLNDMVSLSFELSQN
ncbi:hypothetical protein ABVT43_06225 [Aliikangiella sp. GXAS 311]